MSVALVDDLAPDAAPHALAETAEPFALMLSLEQAGAATPTSLELPPDLDYDTYEAIGRLLGEWYKRNAWYIGDFLVYGEGIYGERFAQAAAETGLSEQTLLNRSYVCRHIPPSRRRPELSFSTHALVAPLGAREQRAWLARAAEHGWTRAELAARMKARRKDEQPQLLPEVGTGGEVNEALLLEAARSLVANAELAGENVIVRREDYARVRAALGEEE